MFLLNLCPEENGLCLSLFRPSLWWWRTFCPWVAQTAGLTLPADGGQRFPLTRELGWREGSPSSSNRCLRILSAHVIWAPRCWRSYELPVLLWEGGVREVRGPPCAQGPLASVAPTTRCRSPSLPQVPARSSLATLRLLAFLATVLRGILGFLNL